MRALVWSAVLAIAGVAMGLVLLCIAPFAAVATFAGRTLPLRFALGTVAAMWFVNQAIGFTFLRYPHTLSTAILGSAIGIAAALATMVARRIPQPLPAFFGAFATFEIVQYAFALVAGGARSFTPAIVMEILVANAFGAAILLALWMAVARVPAMRALEAETRSILR